MRKKPLPSAAGVPVAGMRLTMVLTPSRVAYLGLIGFPNKREYGAIAIYIPADAPKLAARRPDGEWVEADFVVIPPYEPHHIRSDGRLIFCVLIEGETVDAVQTIARLSQAGSTAAARIRDAFGQLQEPPQPAIESRRSFDSFFFGGPLPHRVLDPRIAAITRRIRTDPAAQLSAREGAKASSLSESRFLHLFSAETGTSFRRFRAWKRARSFLGYACESVSAITAAFDSGYPDSTHFSHSIRRFYGCQPKEIFAGSRRLMLITHPEDEAETEVQH